MRYSQLFSKTLKAAPADAETANAKFLIQGGFVDPVMAGVYTWLPLGLATLRKVEQIVREEMNALGASETMMPSLQPKEYWDTTNRWDKVDVLFKLKSQTDKEYALGCTHEEVATPLAQKSVQSYKDLPLAFYQINTKFRDELRAKSGVLRGREFRMKDLYSFHATQEDLNAFYGRVLEAYLRVYARCGLDVKVVEAGGGAFTTNMTHEFQVITQAGEDVLIACPKCTFGQNTEVATLKEGDACPKCGAALQTMKGVEVGNIFDLGTKYSDAFGLQFTDENGERRTVRTASYGIGTTRLVGAIVEAHHDEKGIRWPKSVAPYAVHLVSLKSKNADETERAQAAAQSLYEGLKAEGVDVLWDDRDLSPGQKFADADLIGIPLRLVVSPKSLAAGGVEWKERASVDAKSVPEQDVVESVLSFIRS